MYTYDMFIYGLCVCDGSTFIASCVGFSGEPCDQASVHLPRAREKGPVWAIQAHSLATGPTASVVALYCCHYVAHIAAYMSPILLPN